MNAPIIELHYKVLGKNIEFKVLKLPAKWDGATKKLNHKVYELDYWGQKQKEN